MLVHQDQPSALSCAIYRTTSIGDVVLASAALKYLDLLEKPVVVYWIGRNPALELIQKSYPSVHGIHTEKTDTVEMIESIRSKIDRIDFIVDLQKNLRSQIITRGLSKLYSAPIFTWEKKSIHRSLSIFKSRVFGRARAASPEIRQCSHFQYEAMLQATVRAVERKIGPQNLVATPTLHFGAEDRSWAKELKFGSWLAVAPGAAHPTKRAPLETFIGILRGLRDQLTASASPLNLMFLGDHKDRDQSTFILDQLQWELGSVLNLCGKINLAESGFACSKAKILLSNDSSLAHISEAVDTPVAVLFGPTIEAFGFAPRLPQSRSFSSLLGCRPCSKHGKSACRYGDQLCFTSIPTNEVVAFLSSKVRDAH